MIFKGGQGISKPKEKKIKGKEKVKFMKLL